MIIDGSPAVRRRLAERLSECGWEAVQARDLDEAISALTKKTFDVILFDLHGVEPDDVPRVDALERIRACAPNASLVILTNEWTELSRAECLRRGAQFFFDKSLEFERAVEAVIGVRPTGAA
jgi:DNA-binding NarL/FixJ family response regulator